MNDAIHAAVGGLSLRKDLLKRTTSTDVGQRFVKLLRGALLLLRVAHSAVELGLDDHFPLESPAPSEAVVVVDENRPRIADGDLLST